MKSRHSQRGVSLIETLVAVGILGVVAYFVVGLLKTGTVGQKTLQAQDDARTITENIAAVLADHIACQNTFVTPAGIKPNVTNPIFVVKDSNGTVAYEVGKVYGNRSMKLTSLKVGGSDIDKKTGIQQWSPVGSSSGTAFVEVGWTQTGAGTDNVSGPTVLLRFFLLNVINLNPMGAIADCTAKAPGAGTGYWTLDGSGNIHNNNNNGSGGVGIGTATPYGLLDVSTGPFHALTVLNSGNVGIGTYTPITPLHVTSSASASNTYVFVEGGAAAGVEFMHRGATTNNKMFQSQSFNGGLWFTSLNDDSSVKNNIMYMSSGGNVGIGNSAPGFPLQVTGDVQADSFISTSDERLKTDVHLVAGLGKILQLRGVAFSWIKSGERGIGLIAQEVEKVFPDLVATNKLSGFKAVKYESLIAPLIESVKELYAMCLSAIDSSAKNAKRLAELESNIVAKDAEIRDLERRVNSQAKDLSAIKAKLGLE